MPARARNERGTPCAPARSGRSTSLGGARGRSEPPPRRADGRGRWRCAIDVGGRGVSSLDRGRIGGETQGGGGTDSEDAFVSLAQSDSVSGQYASALVELAQSGNALEAVHEDVDAIAALLKADDSVAAYLKNPVISSEKKKGVLSRLASECELHQSTINFLGLLVDKQRGELIGKICEDFEAMYCELTDTQIATVTSAVKLEDEQQFLIAKKLQEMTGSKNIKLMPKVDESLIAGFVVQYGKDGSAFIDMSVKGQMEKMAAQIAPENLSMASSS